MTDAHFHRNGFDTFLVHDGHEVAFHGLHPWQAAACADIPEALAGIRARLEADSRAGVGEIGLDRLKTKTVPDAQRVLFAAQLALAAELRRPVVLHGAKCWGEVVAACRPYAGRIPAFLFHGFSRSAGLLPQIFALNGFVSVGSALLNDHAVNYRELVKGLPPERLLLETDAVCETVDGRSRIVDAETPEDQAARVARLVRALAALRGCAEAEVEAAVAANAVRFVEAGR